MFEGGYIQWRILRMNGIQKYISPDFFNNKTMLELGCAYADFGNMFYNLGSIVTSSDARNEHLEVVNTKYPHINTLRIDCDSDKIVEHYDIILHCGLLNHLHEIEEHLENVAQQCDVLILESLVCDSDDNTFSISVHESGNNQAYNGKGIRPSPSYIERVLENNGFEYKVIKDPILNGDRNLDGPDLCNYTLYDWEITNSKNYNYTMVRFWICWKPGKCPLINPE